MSARLELFYDTETTLRLIDEEVRATTGGLPHSSNSSVVDDGWRAVQLALELTAMEARATDGVVEAFATYPSRGCDSSSLQ